MARAANDPPKRSAETAGLMTARCPRSLLEKPRRRADGVGWDSALSVSVDGGESLNETLAAMQVPGYLTNWESAWRRLHVRKLGSAAEVTQSRSAGS